MRNSYLGCILLVVLACSCSKTSEYSEEEASTSTATQSEDVLEVQVVKADTEKLSIPITASGKIETGRSKKLAFQQSGLLEQLTISNGQQVKKGQLIAQLANRQQLIQYQEAELTYKQALYLDEDERMFLNDSAFYKDKWSEVNEKTALKSGVPQAKLALDKARISLEQTRLYAPFDGLIADLEVEPGDFISANKPIAQIYQPNNLIIEVSLLEYDFPKISIGQQAEITALANLDQMYTGEVIEINPTIDASGHFTIKIKLKDSTEGLVPGMSATVTIASLKEQSQLIVPMKAVVNRSGRQVVFTHEDGLAKWNYVTLGDQNGEYVEVLEGVAPGSEVIITDVFQLAHDSPVVVQPATESSTASL
ncbi:efflux RND transporter periplasmic adaptor subunit [Marinoscillum sp.]|uniref:efflux RND transporter periplasmic adaptor subunit n=1 Tax=Marinoscillum sp. TaxID=2024838 RepID=UPI003BAA8A03